MRGPDRAAGNWEAEGAVSTISSPRRTVRGGSVCPCCSETTRGLRTLSSWALRARPAAASCVCGTHRGVLAHSPPEEALKHTGLGLKLLLQEATALQRLAVTTPKGSADTHLLRNTSRSRQRFSSACGHTLRAVRQAGQQGDVFPGFSSPQYTRYVGRRIKLNLQTSPPLVNVARNAPHPCQLSALDRVPGGL